MFVHGKNWIVIKKNIIKQILVRIQWPENLKVPRQGLSTEGEQGLRPKGVVDGREVITCFWCMLVHEVHFLVREK